MHFLYQDFIMFYTEDITMRHYIGFSQIRSQLFQKGSHFFLLFLIYFLCTPLHDLAFYSLKWLGTIYVWFHHKIKMLVSAKVKAKALPTGDLNESAFTKHLLIYLLQQTKVFNCGLNAS